MRFRVGDLVAENTNLYWRFTKSSFVYMSEEADPLEGDAMKTIGIVISVHKRFPDAFFDIPYFVYKIKWLNAPEGNIFDNKYFYDDEQYAALLILSIGIVILYFLVRVGHIL